MPSTRTGSLRPSFNIFLFGAIAVSALRLGLYLRLSPFGTPYVSAIAKELPLALLLGWHGIALISLPFFLLAAFTKTSGIRLNTVCLVQVLCVFGSLAIGHVDNEIHRFMGIPLSLNFLETYGNIGKTPESIAHALADDPGGYYSGYLLTAIPASFICGSLFFCLRRPKTGWSVPIKMSYGLIGCLLLYVFPLAVFYGSGLTPTTRERIRPPIFLVSGEIRQILFPEPPTQITQADVVSYRNWWKERDHRKQWEFGKPHLPLRKRYVGPEPTPNTTRPNIIILQLETFRAQNMPLFNPHTNTVSTPFIEQLAKSPKSAYWTRFYCNGLPTVHTFMALHTGVLPHSHERVATAFTEVNLESFPSLLRQRKYHTSFFSGPDPEWDNEQYWLEKWYEKIVFDPSNRDQDRPLFRRAAKYLKENGNEIQPFLSVVVSITNHVPFRAAEPAFEPSENAGIIERLESTMRYTDDVVREFFEAVKNEGWFQNTVLIITGDHGYDLGDRGVFVGHRNLRHESTWVPLVIHGQDPRLPRGQQSRIASHIDLAPTIMELSDIRSDNSFMGHSLLDPDDTLSMALAIRSGSFAVETLNFSVFFPLGAEALAFSSEDPMQLNDIATKNPATVDQLLQHADMLSQLTNYCYESDKIVPH